MKEPKKQIDFETICVTIAVAFGALIATITGSLFLGILLGIVLAVLGAVLGGAISVLAYERKGMAKKTKIKLLIAILSLIVIIAVTGFSFKACTDARRSAADRELEEFTEKQTQKEAMDRATKWMDENW